MFWIGLAVGVVIATIAIAGYFVYSCWKVYGTFETFASMCEVTQAAAENRESTVVVYHDGNRLNEYAVFKEM